MSSRAPIWILLAALAGCALDSTSSKDGSGSSDDAQSGGRLQVVGSASLHVLPSSVVNLAVRYIDANDVPVLGVAVEFAFADTAPGASLMPDTPVTDDRGIARTALRVGSTPGKFRVRASTEGAKPAYIDIVVQESLESSLRVTVTYQGQRKLASRTVTALASTTCEQALASDGSVVGDPTFTLSEPDDVASFALGPGLSYALLAWGRDDTGSVLARGCAEHAAPITSEGDTAKAALDVEIKDIPLRLEGAYPMTLALDVSVSAKRLEAAFESAGSAALPATDTADADVLLDALATKLATENRQAAADALTSARADGTLATSLQSSLDDEKEGPRRFVPNAAHELITRASKLSISGTYGVGSTTSVPMTFDVTDVSAIAADGSTLALYGGDVVPVASIDATYNDTLAVVDVATLNVQLGLGSYGQAVLRASPEALELAWAMHAGCATFVDAVAAIVASDCDEACVEDACTQAREALLGAVTTQLTALDTDHANLGLRGLVYVHDRTGDGLVNDLGPGDLEGNWGKAPTASEPDAVRGEAQKPAPSTLVP